MWLFLGDTLPSRTRRIDPSQFMLHRNGTGSQSQLLQSATGSQPQLSSLSRPPLAMQAHSVDANNGYGIETLDDVKFCDLAVWRSGNDVDPINKVAVQQA